MMSDSGLGGDDGGGASGCGLKLLPLPCAMKIRQLLEFWIETNQIYRKTISTPTKRLQGGKREQPRGKNCPLGGLSGQGTE